MSFSCHGSERVAHDEDNDSRDRHEDKGRDDRATGSARYPADAVSAGASVAEPRSKADEKPGEHECRRRCLDLGNERADHDRNDRGAERKPDKKGEAPAALTDLVRPEKLAKDAADASDSSIRNQQERRR